jgi:cardiolipin synthase
MRALRHLPNTISVIRLLLVVPIAMSMLEGNYLQSLSLFLIAGLSDGMDGYLARRFGWVSAFGKIIDPLADKLLLLVTTIVLAVLGHFPVMVLLLMIAKDLTIVGGILVYTVMAGFPKIRPLFIGKMTTTLQLLLLGYILVTLIVTNMDFLPAVTPILIWLIVLVTLLDGCAYIWVWTNELASDSRWHQPTTVDV